MDISETRALLTGASRGLGQHLARGFAAAGADVALVARSAGPLARELGGRAYTADLTDREELRGLIERVEADGPADILVNNAGDECVGRFIDIDADTLEFMVELKDTPVGVTKVEIGDVAETAMTERGRANWSSRR